MQRGSFRTPGCLQCKKRKIKCDNHTPSCSQCTRLGRSCPGSVSGPVFINYGNVTATPSIASYHHRREASCRLARNIGLALCSPWTPDHWLLNLPQLQLSDATLDALQSPLMAIHLAMETLQTGHKSIIHRQILQHHHDAIRHQKRLLAPVLTLSEPSSDALLGPLVMALSLLEFEILAPSSLHSWRRHARGCLQLLLLLGPEACQVSPFFELYTQMRFIMSYANFFDDMPCFPEKHEWLQTPFKFHPKTQIDTILDSMLLDPNPRHRAIHHLQPGRDSQTQTTSSQSNAMVFIADNLVQIRDVAASPLPSNEQRMIRILSNGAKLCSHVRPTIGPMQTHLICAGILWDAEVILLSSDASSRMAMQCVFTVYLIATLFAPSDAQTAKARELFDLWHHRHTVHYHDAAATEGDSR